MLKIFPDAASIRQGSSYPPPFGEPCAMRVRRALADVAGLTAFGVNLLHLPPGVWSSQRHWHSVEDEFIWVLEGQVILVTDAAEEILQAGDCAGFKAGVADGHHLQNRSQHMAVVLEVGSRAAGRDAVEYPDIDLRSGTDDIFRHKNGQVY